VARDQWAAAALTHGHLRWMRLGPCSSYSALDSHICWNEPSDARMEPPMKTEKRRSTSGLGMPTLTRGAYDDTCVKGGSGEGVGQSAGRRTGVRPGSTSAHAEVDPWTRRPLKEASVYSGFR
jgi:hypothetical protein